MQYRLSESRRDFGAAPVEKRLIEDRRHRKERNALKLNCKLHCFSGRPNLGLVYSSNPKPRGTGASVSHGFSRA